jgi:hypothetical protein
LKSPGELYDEIRWAAIMLRASLSEAQLVDLVFLQDLQGR